ncbi:MAG: DUF6391 domain-containing protein [Cyanobacteria bacterium P01_G01_bin.54]
MSTLTQSSDPLARLFEPVSATERWAQVESLPGIREWMMLRQSHALEHATVWVLEEMLATAQPGQGFEVTADGEGGNWGGLATDRGFYLYGAVQPTQLAQAARCALRRLQQGDWQLALHPRCGTNTLAAIALTSSFTLGAALLLPPTPLTQVLGVGTAALLAMQLAPSVGLWSQRHLTTEIPFNLQVARIFPTLDLWGRMAHFVQVEWCD